MRDKGGAVAARTLAGMGAVLLAGGMRACEAATGDRGDPLVGGEGLVHPGGSCGHGSGRRRKLFSWDDLEPRPSPGLNVPKARIIRQMVSR